MDVTGANCRGLLVAATVWLLATAASGQTTISFYFTHRNMRLGEVHDEQVRSEIRRALRYHELVCGVRFLDGRESVATEHGTLVAAQEALLFDVDRLPDRLIGQYSPVRRVSVFDTNLHYDATIYFENHPLNYEWTRDRVFAVALHEIGHSLGREHVYQEDSVMRAEGPLPLQFSRRDVRWLRSRFGRAGGSR